MSYPQIAAQVAMIDGNFDLPEGTKEALPSIRKLFGIAGEAMHKIIKTPGLEVDLDMALRAVVQLQQAKDTMCQAVILPHANVYDFKKFALSLMAKRDRPILITTPRRSGKSTLIKSLQEEMGDEWTFVDDCVPADFANVSPSTKLLGVCTPNEDWEMLDEIQTAREGKQIFKPIGYLVHSYVKIAEFMWDVTKAK